MTRKPLIAGNWKMNNTHLEAIQLVQNISYHLDADDYDAADIVVIPPFTSLRSVQTVIAGDQLNMVLGAQDVYPKDSGAYTGAVSPSMLTSLDCSFVLAGHSERREIFGDTDTDVNEKVKAILAAEMTPILCVGESAEQRQAEATEEVLAGQVRAGLAGVDPAAVAQMVIAYEPIWAIGTGATALPEDANAGCEIVRATIADSVNTEAASTVRVLYGGSVKPSNAAQLLAGEHVDGALVGGASLNADDFATIARFHRLT